MTDINCEQLADKFVAITEVMTLYRTKYVKSAKFSHLKKEISDRQFTILCILAYGDKNTVSELAEMMGISKSTLSIIMSKMIKKGYLIKTYPTEYDDKRKIYFSLSPSGIEILKSAKKAHIDEAKYLYSNMNENQKNCILMAGKNFASIADDNDIELLKVMNFIPNKNDIIEQMIYSQTLFLASFIRKTHSILKSEFNINGKDGNLTKNQCHLLICIDQHKYNTISKLENFLNSSGSTVSITVSKLVKNGYVAKEYPSGNDDGRVVYLRLTVKGKKALEDVKKSMKNLFLKYVSSLDEKSRNSIGESLDLLLIAFN